MVVWSGMNLITFCLPRSNEDKGISQQNSGALHVSFEAKQINLWLQGLVFTVFSYLLVRFLQAVLLGWIFCCVCHLENCFSVQPVVSASVELVYLELCYMWISICYCINYKLDCQLKSQLQNRLNKFIESI